MIAKESANEKTTLCGNYFYSDEFQYPGVCNRTGALFGMNPDEVQQVIRNEQSSDRLMFDMVREHNIQLEVQQRLQLQQQRYKDQNPYSGCVPLGEVRGGSVEEAKSLGTKLGGTNIQYIETTSTSVKANIYKCNK